VAGGERVDLDTTSPGVADDERARRDLAAHYGAGADDRVVADRRAGQAHGAGADEHALADRHAGDPGAAGEQPRAAVVSEHDRARGEPRLVAGRDSQGWPASM